MSKMYEVEVRFIGTEFYQVKANSEEEAKKNWLDGMLLGDDGHSYEVESVAEMFEDDEYDFAYVAD